MKRGRNNPQVEHIGNATLYRGDSRLLLDEWEPMSFDACITDPPYGVNFKYEEYEDTLDNWKALMQSVVPLLQGIAPFVVMPSGGVDRLHWWYQNYPPSWLIAWYKGARGHLSSIGFNGWEPHVCWGRPSNHMFDYFGAPGGFPPDGEGHPCPKRVEWALWLVKHATLAEQVVLDPFLGSGTTGIACAQLQRRFVGIELTQSYFDLACQRIEHAYKAGSFFRPPSTPRGRAHKQAGFFSTPKRRVANRKPCTPG